MSNRKHSIRMLGIAFVAVFAMSAMAASAASAAEFHAAESPSKVNAVNEGAHVFTAGLVGSISCNKATFKGTEFVASPSKTVEVAPVYSECTFLGVGTTVNMNKCTYRFNQPTGAGPFTGTVNVICPIGNEIEFSAGTCTVKVPAQGPLSSLTYTNQGVTPNRRVKVVSNVSGITYNAGIGCNGTPGVHNDGTYKGTAIAAAETEAEEIVEAWIE